MGQAFNKGLETGKKQERLLKRLNNLEDKTDNQLRAIKSQEDRQLDKIGGSLGNKEVVSFYDEPSKEIKELEDRDKNETIENIKSEGKTFYIKISDKVFNINKYTNLNYFGLKLFRGKISLEKAENEGKKYLI